jgi:predicted glycoside hydrolase/deacetylase ChbG (UPF0249 family)
MPTKSALIVTADDYGYAAAYDRGILAAAGAGALDAVSAMVGRAGLEPEPLLASGVEIGLHLELAPLDGRAGEGDIKRADGELTRQLERFESLFGRPAAYLDGHHHAHAWPGLAAPLARVASELGLPVRSVDARHRRLLRSRGVATQDWLIGRLRPSEPALPKELAAGGELPEGIGEWMTHPGYEDGAAGAVAANDPRSSYDREREEDLRLLLQLGDRQAWRTRGIERRTHAEALKDRPTSAKPAGR